MSSTTDSVGAATAPRKDLVEIQQTIREPWVIPVLVFLLGLCLAFWGLVYNLPALWTRGEGYYSHGMIVPLISAYVIAKNWPDLRTIPVRPFWFAAIPLALVLFGGIAAGETDVQEILSLMFVLSIVLAIWTVAGGRWARKTLPAVAFLFFMLPVWDMIIDRTTQPLQVLSTDVAYEMLKLIGMAPYRIAGAGTYIYLNQFTLNVGAPCSGLKLIISVSAFTIFFMLIARLKFFANMMFVALILPICLLMNGLRIAMIGIVGNLWGNAAGNAFHDYSGYIMLLVCFALLFKIAKVLGWKE